MFATFLSGKAGGSSLCRTLAVIVMGSQLLPPIKQEENMRYVQTEKNIQIPKFTGMAKDSFTVLLFENVWFGLVMKVFKVTFGI